MRSMSSIAMLALATGVAGFAHAGVYVEMADRKVGSQENTVVQRMYVQGTAGRFVDVAEHGGDTSREAATIIKDGTLYAIDDEEKSYVMLDKASLDQLGKKLSAGLEQMKEQLAKMPPEQREQMEQMLSKQIPGFSTGDKWTVEAAETGKSDKVDGRTCRLWDVKRNGELDEQLCVVPFGSLPGKENFQSVFGNFAKVFEEMAKTVPMLAGLMSNEFAAQEKINGFPVRSRDYENGKLSDKERVMSVWREENVPASMFQIPEGYKRKTMEEMAGH